MKTIPSIIAASLLIASVSATASTYENSATDTLVTGPAVTQAAALQQASNKLSQLKSVSPRQLSWELSSNSVDALDDTFHLNEGSFVSTEERMDANGKISYVGLVNVNFGYTVDDSEN